MRAVCWKGGLRVCRRVNDHGYYGKGLVVGNTRISRVSNVGMYQGGDWWLCFGGFPTSGLVR